MQTACFKNTLCSYSEGRKWCGVAEVGLHGQKEKKKKLPGESAEARGQVTQRIKTPHAFCTSPCQWGLSPVLPRDIWGCNGVQKAPDSRVLPFRPEGFHVVIKINVLWHPLGLPGPWERLMKKYNLAREQQQRPQSWGLIQTGSRGPPLSSAVKQVDSGAKGGPALIG